MTRMLEESMKEENAADADHVFLARFPRTLPANLSSREIAFLRFASQGKTAGEIAVATAVTERTANFHIANAIEKLGASNKTHAVALAMRLGLLD